jgi:small redox-active disulfide protein 2
MFFKKQDEPRKAESTQVKIGGVRVGIIGLDDAMEAVKKRNLETDSEIGDALVELLRPNNYIPDAALDEYRADLARHYRVRMGMPVAKRAPVPGLLEIKILGAGCIPCKQVFELVRDVVAEEGIAADLEYIDDIAEFLNYGIFITPALLINGEVKLAGKAPTKNQLVAWLKEAGS